MPRASQLCFASHCVLIACAVLDPCFSLTACSNAAEKAALHQESCIYGLGFSCEQACLLQCSFSRVPSMLAQCLTPVCSVLSSPASLPAPAQLRKPPCITGRLHAQPGPGL